MPGIQVVPQQVAQKVECQGRDEQKKTWNQKPGEIHQVAESGNLPVNQASPADGGIHNPQPQIGENGLSQDKAGNSQSYAHDNDGRHLGDDLPEDNGEGGDPLQYGVGDKILPFYAVHQSPYQTGRSGPAHKGEDYDNDHIGLSAGHAPGQDGPQKEDQVQSGDQDEKLGKPHNKPIHLSPVEPRQASEGNGQGHGDGYADKTDCKADAAAVEDTGEEVPSQVVRSHKEYRVGFRIRTPFNPE